MKKTWEYPSAHHQSKEFEVLVDVAERVLLLKACNDRLSSSQFSRFVKLLNDLVRVLKLALLSLLVLVHQLKDLFLSAQRLRKFVLVILAGVQPIKS